MTQPDPTTIIHTAQSQSRHLLTEVESKALLRAAGLDVVRTELASSRDQAVGLAEDLGWPVVLKVCSPDIVHKSDIGGVRLNLGSAEAVGQAYDAIMNAARTAQPNARLDGVSVQPMARPGIEVIIGLTTDPQFGALIMFGLGGVAGLKSSRMWPFGWRRSRPTTRAA